MSTTAVAVPAKDKLKHHLQSDLFLEEVGKVVPRHMKPERMVRVALTALTRTPRLAECEPATFFRCLLDLSQWGLEPDGRHAHLIPYRNRKRNVTECQLIIDYKGYVRLAYQSGHVKSIHADVVRHGDLFVYDRGEVQHHTPWFLRQDYAKPKEAGEVMAAYCFVALKDGAEKSEVLSLQDIERIRSRSQSANNGPWVTDWDEMAKKTAFRRVSKWIPLSAELQDAISLEDECETVNQGSQGSTVVSNLDQLADALDGERDEKAVQVDAESVYASYKQSIADAPDARAVQEVIAEVMEDDRLDEAAKMMLNDWAAAK